MTKSKQTRRATKRDLQVEKFDKRDLGDDIRAAGGGRVKQKRDWHQAAKRLEPLLGAIPTRRS